MRSGFSRAATTALWITALTLRVADGRADEAFEPTRGRIEGDVTIAVAVGATLAPRGPRAEGEVRLRYLETTGLFATYEDAALVGSDSEPRRVLATGIELRPLFLFRWLRGLETARPRFDLALDSLALEMGASFQQTAGSALSSRPGLQAGMGLELPIGASATGVWVGIHGGLRWADDALTSGTVGTADGRSAYLTIAFGWHQVVRAHVVDVGDESSR